ncbi:dehydration-responsive element-binding protein 1B-like [Arachis ipaensis]|uniref:dehydration-responsive element-binding protein 1B-like n=1 Tax=Arachis ipaensis TaxID=130454 RepID=UPI0007AF942C|nr:dehydration-responsive element-binding protein 1B-like [Arachis ipaensis]
MQKRKAGRKKFQETRHPIYKGVRQRNGKWVCELRQPNNKTRVWLGTFSHPQMAAIAHDVAALAFRGENASLNFPQSAASLPRLNAETTPLKSIQITATQVANNHFVEGREEIMSILGSNDASSHEEELSSDCSFGEDSRSFYWDEEEVFNMPGLMNSLAEALIITPPALERGFNWVGVETTMDLTLWGD